MGPKQKRTRRPPHKPVRTVQELKKEAFSNELKLSTLNTKRYQSLWREMLTRIKMPDIYKKINIIWQTSEHVFDLKDYRYTINDQLKYIHIMEILYIHIASVYYWIVYKKPKINVVEQMVLT